MNLLVTGGSGFIGHNFIKFILPAKLNTLNKVVILDCLSYASNYENTEELLDDFTTKIAFEKVNLKDYDYVQNVFDKYDVTHVVHFAAESHVDNSINGPRPFLESNLIGTFNLLECARRNKDIRFHHISTDEVYGSLGEKGSFKEKTPYNPLNPYSATKAGSDFLVRSYVHTFNLQGTISNCSNNYGPFQHSEKFIPTVINNILRKKKIPIYGEGKNIRDWIHVEDHCSAIWTILTKGKIGETYNVGARCEKTNMETIQLICKHMKAEPEMFLEFVKDRPGHDFRYAIDNTKIKKELGWKPKIRFDNGLKKTIKHYEYNMEIKDLSEKDKKIHRKFRKRK